MGYTALLAWQHRAQNGRPGVLRLLGLIHALQKLGTHFAAAAACARHCCTAARPRPARPPRASQWQAYVSSGRELSRDTQTQALSYRSAAVAGARRTRSWHTQSEGGGALVVARGGTDCRGTTTSSPWSCGRPPPTSDRAKLSLPRGGLDSGGSYRRTFAILAPPGCSLSSGVREHAQWLLC